MKNKLWQQIVASILLMAIFAMSIVPLAGAEGSDTVSPADMKFEDYEGLDYNLESFLNGYNVLSFGNVSLETHCMGALLIQGNLDMVHYAGYADGADLPPSYVAGSIKGGPYNSRDEQVQSPLYAGPSNEVVFEYNQNLWRDVYSVNGVTTGYGGRTPAYSSSDFFDFNRALQVIREYGAAMAKSGTVVTPDESGKLTINAGEHVIIESMNGISEIDIVGDTSGTSNTIINVLQAGEITGVPVVKHNGKQPEVVEQSSSGTAIVWNFPNATKLVTPTGNWIGHVIAPEADVTQPGGNYNGCYVCKSFTSAAEGHVYPYSGEVLPGNPDAPETPTVEKITISGSKTWNDDNNRDGKRPGSITINLHKNGSEIAEKTVTANDNWQWSFTDLPKTDDSGNQINYSITEDYVNGYSTQVNGYNVTNTHEPEKITVSGSKTWNDDNNRDGKRPQSIKVNLFANGNYVSSQTVTESNNWSWSFTNLNRYENGGEISYTVTEDSVANYTTQINGLNIINTYNTEKVSVSGSKTWNDDNNRDGKRPQSIKINLFADGSYVSSQTVTASNNWNWNFNDLPAYQNGNRIAYTVSEDAVEGYTAQINGYSITNTHQPELTSVSGSKTWDDNNNQDGKRPTSIMVNLLANGSEIAEKEVTEADGWAWTFDNLYKYENGSEIVYSVTEDAVKDYTAKVEGFNITNTYETESTSVSGSKTWVDADNQDGIRPQSITIRLYANGGEIANKTVTAADGWAWSFTGLDKYAGGSEISYTITEDAVAGYTTVISGYNVTNTHVVEKTSVSGSKTWNDNNNQDGKRPASIVINLLADGVEVAEKVVTAADNWAWSFTNLDKNAGGKAINYTVTEDAVEGYTTVVNGYDVTNTHEIEKTNVSGIKNWNDNNNQDGKRPASITINLLADGAKISSKTVTAADGWAWNFTNLDKYAGGREIVYTITEDAVEGYTTVVEGYNVTNTHEIEKTTVSGGKTWVDADNQDGKRPASITVNLFANGVEVAEKTVTAADGWTWSFTNLDKYAGGKAINYTVTEDAVEGYTATVSGYNVTNTYEPEKITVSGSKTWVDADNQDGKRPASITINLYANGTFKESKTVTAADSWSWSFTGLDRYSGGSAINYTITENAVEGYTTAVSGYNVTNTHETEKVSVSGKKTWIDADNQDGKRPASIVINLLADGTFKESRIVTEADNWAWNFTGLDKYVGGREIVYTITENPVAGYTTAVDGYNVTNTHEVEKINISGSKTWNDANNQDGKRPQSINVHLLANGSEVAQQTVNASDDWAWEFNNFPKYNNGNEIVYTVTEDAVAGYTTVVNGYNITNTYEPESTSVSGSKTWNDDSNRDGVRPAYITIRLYADGTEIACKNVTEADGWNWSFTDLPRYEAGSEIVYTVKEDAVDGYTTAISGYNVTNTHNPEKINVGGSKTWVDADNQDGKRPEYITINLLANGKKIDSVLVTEEKGWAWSFNDLFKYEGGKEIVYTVTEDAVADYTTEIVGFNAVNTHEPEKTVISGSKTWVDDNNQDGIRPESITVRLLADGTEIASKTVTEADGWAWSFDNLPSYKNGKLISYNILEDEVAGYTATISGGNITNNHTADVIDIKVTKVWSDDNNKYGFRPDSVTVQLYADGNAVGEAKVIDENSGWCAEWKELPKNANGNAIVYTATELPVEHYTANTVSNANGIVITNTLDNPDVSISKREISGVDELPGAVIRITLTAPANENDTLANVKSSLETKLDAEDMEISWTSVETEANKLWGMPAGEYTFTEITAPNGYEVAETIKFKIGEDKSISVYNESTKKYEAVDSKTVVMYDAPITANFSKQEAGGGPELKGAELIIKPVDKTTKLDGVMVPENVTKDTKNNVIKWVSGDDTTKIGKLPEGEYTLTEITAPEGYEVAETIKFRVNADASVSVLNPETGKYEDVTANTVVMFDAPITANFSKQAAGGGPELKGAELIIKPVDKTTKLDGVKVPENVTKDTKNNVIKWVSGDKPTEIGKLPAGEYTLTEITAPEGYEIAETIKFRVNKDASVSVLNPATDKYEDVTANTVVMFDAPIKAVISKQAVGGGLELAGAKLEIKPAEKGITFDKVEVPEGVNKDTKKNVISWTSGNSPVSIGMLPAGEYTLTEITAPKGYEVAETIKFRINDNHTVSVYDADEKEYVLVDDNTVVMFDAPSNAKFSKQAAGGGFELEGAKLEIKPTSRGVKIDNVEVPKGVTKDTKTNIISWTSGKTPIEIGALPEGNYLLTEITAPEGYEIAETIKFRVNGDNTVSVFDPETKKYVTVDDNTVVMYDEPSSVVSAEGKGMFSFIKRSDKGMNLSGAEFRLQGGAYDKTVITTTSGVVAFVNIPEGTYTLTEVNAPVGYTKSDSVITVAVSKEGIITLKNSAGSVISLGDLEKAMINKEKVSVGPTTTTAAPTTTTAAPTTTTTRNLGMVYGDGDQNNPNYYNPSMGDESGKAVQIALIGLGAAVVVMLGCVAYGAVRRKKDN